MIPVASVYQKVADQIMTDSNGELSFEWFNRNSPLAELKLIDWITGDIEGKKPPEPYTTQKDKDWASPFIKKFPTHIVGGEITRPDNYYGYENMYVLGYLRQTQCDEDDNQPPPQDTGNVPIDLLDGEQFTQRQRTYIEELKPSFKKPIAKAVGKNFEFFPKDLGSITLEYYRYPVYAKIISELDTQYNQEVINEATSTNYEWDEKAMPILVWFIVDMFANRTSNQSMKQFNAATSKTPQG